MRSRPPSLCSKSLLEPPLLVLRLRERRAGVGRRRPCDAYSAAARPARAPNTSSSGSEFEPSRLAPLMLTQAASPAAYRPGSGVAPLMSVWTPPIM